ncbi:MAG: hypothetical protein HY887_03250 [Deltaproteobacteria bacterium]|nr:hypothetical protein [Deltaproteobacteria bacterium]
MTDRRCMVRRIIAAVVLLAAFVLAVRDASAIVDVEGRYWLSNLDSSVKVTDAGIIGSDIDFARDLGLDDKKGFLEGRITLELGSHKLRYGFVPLSWTGSQTVTQTLSFAGQTYGASTRVDTDIKIDYHRLGYEYDIIDLLNNRLGIIVELKYFDWLSKLVAPGAGITSDKSFKAPVPTIGVTGQVGLPFLFSIGGEITGLGIGKKAYLVDAEAGVNIKPAPFVIVSAGYRYFKLHLESGDDSADASIIGPYFAVRADF